ncbi:MAG: stalk domain-containing protein [Bacillota bacterium]|jgi:uncharacterized protein YkwD
MNKFKKLLLVMTVVAVFLGLFTLPGAAAKPISVIVNGTTLQLDVAPVIEKNRVLLPIRAISESLGAKVNYIAQTKCVDIYKGSDVIKIYLDQKNALVNGKTVTMDVPAKAISGRTLLPIRFVGESLGTNINWDNINKVVRIGKSTGNTDPTELTTMQQEIFKLVNIERSKKGLSAYKFDTSLNNMAKAHSIDMAENNFFSHTSPTYGDPQARAQKYGIRNIGENIAYGYPSAHSVVTGFMNSPSHRANLLSSSFKYVGIGLHKKPGTTNTDIYVTMNFSYR